MSTLMQASREWSNRPSDERFLSLHALHNHCLTQKDASAARNIQTKEIHADVADDQLVLRSERGIVAPTHWAFGQLSRLAGAPPSYLRTLHPSLVADCLNYGLQIAKPVEEVKVLVTRPQGSSPVVMRALTGTGYGRVWNSAISGSLVSRFGNGLDGEFTVPGVFGKALTEITKDNTTLFAGDRDMFVFLSDEKNKITVPNRRDGKSGELSRGFFVWNSEVGSTSFGFATFLFDYVCANRIVWGAEGYREMRVRHTERAPSRWLDEVVPAIEDYSRSETKTLQDTIASAQRTRISDVDAFLKTRKFSMQDVAAVKAAHLEDEGRPMETAWDVVTGITARARSIGYQADRVSMEREAGKILTAAGR